MRIQGLYRELISRRVFRTLALYVIAAWLALQAADVLFPGIGLPDWAIRYVFIAALAGCPVAVIFAWFFQLTPTGLVRSNRTSVVGEQQPLRRSDYIILLAFLVVIGMIAYGMVSRLRAVPDVAYTPAGSLISEHSLVVLPFISAATVQAEEILADGFTEALNNALVRAPGLDIVARGAASRLKGQKFSAQEAGLKLGAAFVLQGTLRLRENDVHVTAELVDTRKGLTRWSESYDRSTGEMLAVQRDIVEQIVLNLGVKPGAMDHGLAPQTINAAAFESYSRGRFFWNQRTPEGLQQAKGYFEEAISLDPKYALAWSGLADAFVSLYDYGEMTLAESAQQATNAINQALLLDPLLAAAHNSRAHMALHQWQWSDAQSEFEKAIELDPGYAPAYHWYALCLTAIGRLDLAIGAMKQAQVLDPLSARINADLGMALFAARAYDEAIHQEERTLEIDPDAVVPHWVMGMAYAAQGEYDTAIASFEEALRRWPEDPSVLGSLGYTFARAGRIEDARSTIARLENAKDTPTDPFFVALVYAGLDDRPAALNELERAVKAHSGSVRYLKIDARLDNLRGEPQFKALLREVGL